MSYIKLGAIALSLFTVTAFVWASESDELRERARAMQREAAELAERGHGKEAENLERKALAMVEEAEHLEHHRPNHRDAEIREMQERLEKLRLEERELKEIGGKEERLVDVRQEAERIERELHELSHGEHPEEAGSHNEIARRLEHMRIAVEHLNHAGLHDIAEHVAERAEGNIIPVENLAESLQVAHDAGAKRVLLPMASVSDIPTIPGELFAKFQTGFYSDPRDAAFKALGVE